MTMKFFTIIYLYFAAFALADLVSDNNTPKIGKGHSQKKKKLSEAVKMQIAHEVENYLPKLSKNAVTLVQSAGTPKDYLLTGTDFVFDEEAFVSGHLQTRGFWDIMMVVTDFTKDALAVVSIILGACGMPAVAAVTGGIAAIL